MGGDPDQNNLVRSAAPLGAHVTCAPLFFPGPWDTVVVPTEQFFSLADVRRGTEGPTMVAYGPAHLFRAAWLAGAFDYLREPWSADELFLRVRGPRPPRLRWSSGGDELVLDGSSLSSLSSPSATVKLSPAETELLRLLVQRRGLPVARAVLAWGTGCTEGRAIDTLMGRLRTKIGAVNPLASVPHAVRGVGYRLP